MNTPQGASVAFNASKINMRNIEQESSGGELSHNTSDLTQVGVSQNAKSGGKIINRVDGGMLHQEKLSQSVESEGEIVNEVKKN